MRVVVIIASAKKRDTQDMERCACPSRFPARAGAPSVDGKKQYASQACSQRGEKQHVQFVGQDIAPQAVGTRAVPVRELNGMQDGQHP